MDWREAARDPVVRSIGRSIARRWGLWVGVVTRAGRSITLGGSEGPPACAPFMGRIDREGSCRSSLLGWGKSREAQPCHAFFEAETVLIEGAGGTLYASGFRNEPEDIETSAARARRAVDLQLSAGDVSDRIERSPALNQADRKAVRTLLEFLRDHIKVGLGEETNQATDSPGHDYSHIVGQSLSIRRLFSLLDRVVRNDSTVLIQGENGTGKELIARAIHNNGRRQDNAFVTQNCSALNDNLLDSELFGHRRGAFTGAVADKKGLFELADGGTLFLDEVGDMSTTMQVKLLRVLQESTFLPVGDTTTRKVDVRVIAASNRILSEMVRDGSFREDLFYRLNVINLDVPPVRQRPSDVPLLIDHFLAEYAHRVDNAPKTLSDETRNLLSAYHWPGNVRELRHEVERLAVLSGPESIIEADLVSRRIVLEVDPELAARQSDADGTLPEAVEALERRMISEALEECGWNKTQAARRLGVSRRNLIRKVQAYRLRPRKTSISG